MLLHTKHIGLRPCGFREEEFSYFFDYKPMLDNDAPGRGQFGPQRHGWQDLWRGLLNIDTHTIFKLWVSWFQNRRFLGVPLYNPMGAIRCHGHQSSDPSWSKT